MTEVLGDVDEPGVDTEIIIRKFGIPDAHGEEAIEEARRLGGAVRREDLRGRTDFRPIVTVTIDGEHARDFDDAITLEKLPNGNYWLGVHIADVAHYVAEGSALDEEAYERATSVLLPGSRRSHVSARSCRRDCAASTRSVDRLVQSCLMEVDRKGTVVRYEMHDGVIHSNARMTYTERERHPDRSRSGCDRAYAAARAALRDDAGSLRHPQQAPPPPRIDRFRPEGSRRSSWTTPGWSKRSSRRSATWPTGSSRSSCCWPTRRSPRTSTRTTCRRCTGFTRIPDPMKVEEFEEFIATLGYTLNARADNVKPRDFQRLVEKMRGKPEEKPIAFLMLRTMQKARYDPREPRPLRPRGGELHAFHVADSPVSGPRGAPHAAGIASRPDGRDPPRGADRRPAGDRPPHLRARTPRR